MPVYRVTVIVAAWLVAEPAEFVATATYVPPSEGLVEMIV